MPGMPPLPRSFSRADLETCGFVGWETWEDLRHSGFERVPADPLVYVVYRPATSTPTFRKTSPAGHHKGQDPTVAIPVLEENWVASSQVMNIGKADKGSRRLGEYGRFGAGANIGHKGGRYIWQLADSGELLVAWHVISWDELALDYEKRLLAHFAAQHDGAWPFANLKG
jgi:hypothetical protein